MRVPFIILFAATLSFGAEKPRVVVVPFSVGEGASEASAGKFTRVFSEELKSRDDVMDVVNPPATAKAAPPPPAEKPAPAAAGKKSGPSAETLAALDAGKKALADLKFDEAIAALKKGIDLSLADPATADYPAVLEAYISLGVSAFRVGDDKEASAALFNLARLDPNYQLPGGYPPIFGREFEKAKKKVAKQPKASVSVEGPAGATAFVDGRDLGMVPVLEENLAPGLHYVKVEGAKGERYGHTVDLKSGVAKVKATFGGAAEKEEKRAPIAPVASSGGVADPRVGALIDADTQSRIAAYTKAAGAEWAVVGIVYRTGDQQLTAGTAVYSAKKQAMASLPPISFDSDVLTANVEAYKLADALGDKLASFASSSMPIALVTKGAVKVANSGGTGGSKDEVAAVVAERKVVKPKKDEPKKEEPKELVPKEDVRALENKSNVVEDPKHDEPPPGPVVKSGGVPVWVWIVAGVAVAAGGGVGAYFGVNEANKPVTGSVTATW